MDPAVMRVKPPAPRRRQETSMSDRTKDQDVGVHGEGEEEQDAAQRLRHGRDDAQRPLTLEEIKRGPDFEQVPFSFNTSANHHRQAGCGCLGPSALPAAERSAR